MPRAWNDEQLKAAVVQARCVADVVRALGGTNPRTVLAQAAPLGLEIPRGKRPNWTDEDFRAAVAESKTIREALKRLNVQGRGDNYRTFQRNREDRGRTFSRYLCSPCSSA